MRIYLAALALSAATVHTACAAEQSSAAPAQHHLTVTGPREVIERFLALQGSHNPPLATSVIRPLDDGRVTAVVTLSAGQGDQSLLQTVREARAAGLSYQYADAGSNRLRRR